MTLPWLVRLAGSPLIALVLFVLYGMAILGWYQGHLAWWLALGAVGAAIRTLGAVRQVQRYKTWVSNWRAMGDERG